jgi:hypothetical protein
MDEKTVQVRWLGVGRRIMRRSDGMARDYDWAGPGAVVEVAEGDLEKVLTEPYDRFEVVPDSPAPADTSAVAPEPPVEVGDDADADDTDTNGDDDNSTGFWS